MFLKEESERQKHRNHSFKNNEKHLAHFSFDGEKNEKLRENTNLREEK